MGLVTAIHVPSLTVLAQTSWFLGVFTEMGIQTGFSCCARAPYEWAPQVIRSSIALIKLHLCAKFRVASSRQLESTDSPE